MDMGGVTFAAPSTSEKGYLDVKITVSTLGGHSSVPPAHTVRGNHLALNNYSPVTEHRSPLPLHSNSGR